jgi:protein-S-isoprenylcysteine O-methyltransferase Ste14
MSTTDERSTVSLVISALAFTLVAPTTVMGLVPFGLLHHGGGLPLANWRWDAGPLAWLGWPLAFIGLFGYVVCVVEFVARGRGTPNPFDAPRRLVIDGLYRHVRNPMYVAVGTVLLAEALVTGRGQLLGWLGCLWLAFHVTVLVYEEPHLRRVFGEDYDRYRRAVPRWIPRARPWDGP